MKLQLQFTLALLLTTPTAPNPTPTTLTRWGKEALGFFLQYQNCTKAKLTTPQHCLHLSQLKPSQFSLYYAEASNSSSSRGVVAILPDSRGAASGPAHSGVLALDPYPLSTFGHFILLLYVDVVRRAQGQEDSSNSNESSSGEGQMRLCLIEEGHSVCLTLIKKPRCPNTIGHLGSRRCEIDFLPTVVAAAPPPAPDLLQCQGLPGFFPCPRLRPLEEASKLLCDPGFISNSKRCDSSHTLGGVAQGCKLFQTCDRAVLVGGGWNRATSPSLTLLNLLLMEGSLRALGFGKGAIKTFYANGSRRRGFHSSAMKRALRGHLRGLCSSPHCADSLFIYLNNPVSAEGDMLLWDVDGNGVADELEVYRAREFLADIAGCAAKRVILLVEQSYGDVLLGSLRSSGEHENVVMINAHAEPGKGWNGEFGRRWTNASSASECISKVFESTSASASASNRSSFPLLYDASRNGLSSRVSIVGSPCQLSPRISGKELSSLYQGCQNVPTSTWFSYDFEDLGDAVSEAYQEGGGDDGGGGARLLTKPAKGRGSSRAYY